MNDSQLNITQLKNKSRDELLELAKKLDISNCTNLKKHDIIMRLLQAHTEQQGNIFRSGILETMSDGYGFLRQETLLPSPADIYVSQSQIRRFGLRTPRASRRGSQNARGCPIPFQWYPIRSADSSGTPQRKASPKGCRKDSKRL